MILPGLNGNRGTWLFSSCSAKRVAYSSSGERSNMVKPLKATTFDTTRCPSVHCWRGPQVLMRASSDTIFHGDILHTVLVCSYLVNYII